MRALKNILCLDDFEPAARRRLPLPIFGYISGGAERNASMEDSMTSFGEYCFRPRTLVDVSGRTCRTSLFGEEYAAPIGIAPIGISAIAAYRGDIALAAAACAEQVPFIMSGASLIRLEEVAEVYPKMWFQAYLPGDESRLIALVERVRAARIRTLVLTVDTCVQANRENNVRVGFSTPLRPSVRLAWQGVTHPRWLAGTALRTLATHGVPHFENSLAVRGVPIISRNATRDFSKRDHLNWKHIELIRRSWPGNLVIKGILAPSDACLAREHGVDGIVVSNHGGRQLDGATAPLRVLRDVLDVSGDMTVMLDGAVRRGTDVLKAMALGAKAVLIGRPMIYAAAVGGEHGVRHAIRIVREEIDRDMALLGVPRLEDLNGDAIIRRDKRSRQPSDCLVAVESIAYGPSLSDV
ncbi:alpha-hydroxy-acid oxidizing enzyme [Burkholderia sp. WAC0059]|uniref:alpha-hydroxy acid oxidase n=1 Tax=Burkholderia sp. WAC0059 TaxID=2066022 RepID=UPI000C7EED87|nr:alpha-hydroxy acid oxidase [Burkholderia sp. WAC0059]PLZ00009.1 alpha-hydroxy-acid oxidizing enzyme [Burkholderia sp. WAC0059]